MKVMRYELRRSHDVLLEILYGEDIIWLRIHGWAYDGDSYDTSDDVTHEVSKITEESANYFLQKYGVGKRTLIVEKGD